MNNLSEVKKTVISFLPEKGNSVNEQATSCLADLTKKLVELKVNSHHILKQNIFLKVENHDQFLERKGILQNILEGYYSNDIPPTGMVSQAPANGAEIAIEVTIALDNDIKIEDKSFDNINYKIVRVNDYIEIFACGITSLEKTNDIQKQSEIAFEKMSNILSCENLDFSSVIRQWNYIERIHTVSANNGRLIQNYQIFNDVRSKYYLHSGHFTNGYPAATGIGMDVGGVSIDFIAASSSKQISVHSIKNPMQIDAHLYGKTVLIGSNNKKTSPKFERAKVVSNHYAGEIYISGTAAIRGQETIERNEIEGQTIATIENIKELISIDNLRKNGAEVTNDSIKLCFLRVYINNKRDFNKVAELCNKYFPKVPTLYLIAEICRDNLLVEIEGKAIF